MGWDGPITARRRPLSTLAITCRVLRSGNALDLGLEAQVTDVAVIESNLLAITRQITAPVRKELEQSAKLSVNLGWFSLARFGVGLIVGRTCTAMGCGYSRARTHLLHKEPPVCPSPTLSSS